MISARVPIVAAALTLALPGCDDSNSSSMMPSGSATATVRVVYLGAR
jgi:hypothetical protein